MDNRDDSWYFGKRIKSWWSKVGGSGWMRETGTTWLGNVFPIIGAGIGAIFSFWSSSNAQKIDYQRLQAMKQNQMYIVGGSIFVVIWLIQSKWKPR